MLDILPCLCYYTNVAPADIAQPVERILGKDEVPSSNLGISSRKTCRKRQVFCVVFNRFQPLANIAQRSQCPVFDAAERRNRLCGVFCCARFCLAGARITKIVDESTIMVYNSKEKTQANRIPALSSIQLQEESFMRKPRGMTGTGQRTQGSHGPEMGGYGGQSDFANNRRRGEIFLLCHPAA